MTCGSRAEVHYVDDCRLCRACETNCPQNAMSVQPLRKIEPVVKISNSWDEIARWIGCNPGVLNKTIEDYNAACDQGYDKLFCKSRELLYPLRTSPFYAIKANSDYLDTLGGIKINERMEVIDKSDKPIKGLYAAGMVTGGWQSDCYCDYLSGAASGFAVTGGRIAAENAIKIKKRNSI